MSLPKKEFRIMIVKVIQNLENKMELQINRLETRIDSENGAVKAQVSRLHALESHELPGGWGHPVWQVDRSPSLMERLPVWTS